MKTYTTQHKGFILNIPLVMEGFEVEWAQYLRENFPDAFRALGQRYPVVILSPFLRNAWDMRFQHAEKSNLVKKLEKTGSRSNPTAWKLWCSNWFDRFGSLTYGAYNDRVESYMREWDRQYMTSTPVSTFVTSELIKASPVFVNHIRNKRCSVIFCTSNRMEGFKHCKQCARSKLESALVCGDLSVVDQFCCAKLMTVDEQLNIAVEHQTKSVIFLFDKFGVCIDDEFVDKLVKHGHIDVVKYLVDKGFVRFNESHVNIAAQHGHLDIVKYFVEDLGFNLTKIDMLKVSDQDILDYINGVKCVVEDGTKKWYKDGKLHRENGPAIEYTSGRKEWYKNGKLHRENKPAIEHANGDKYWYNDGNMHRDGDKPAVEYTSGRKEWYKNGERHRDGDKPAIEHANEHKSWWKDGNMHRDGDKPAIEYANGTLEWYKNGERHRDDDKPAVESTNGDKSWWKDGKFHREGDKPAIEYADGGKHWYKNGKLHRDDDKPAVELANGTLEWYKDGKFHREGDKPAIEYANGTKHWYKNGVKYTPEPQKNENCIHDDCSKSKLDGSDWCKECSVDRLFIYLTTGNLHYVKMLSGLGLMTTSDQIEHAMDGDQADVVKYLCDKHRIAKTHVLLGWAIRSGKLSVVRMLTENDCSYNLGSCLSVAAQYGRLDIVKYFVEEHDADVSKISGDISHIGVSEYLETLVSQNENQCKFDACKNLKMSKEHKYCSKHTCCSVCGSKDKISSIHDVMLCSTHAFDVNVYVKMFIAYIETRFAKSNGHCPPSTELIKAMCEWAIHYLEDSDDQYDKALLKAASAVSFYDRPLNLPTLCYYHIFLNGKLSDEVASRTIGCDDELATTIVQWFTGDTVTYKN